jgi:ribonuclease HI
MKYLIVYTDGACSGNPGPGGYGIIIQGSDFEQEISGGFRKTTNNRMEIMAAIVGLESLKEKSSVILYSDSKYLVDAISEGWAKRWKTNGWKRNKVDKALNSDLWDRLLNICSFHDVKFSWVKGHDKDSENNRCDQLATDAIKKENLKIDTVYESIVAGR